MPNVHLAELKHARYFQQALRECHRLYRSDTDTIKVLTFRSGLGKYPARQKWAANHARSNRAPTIVMSFHRDAGVIQFRNLSMAFALS